MNHNILSNTPGRKAPPPLVNEPLLHHRHRFLYLLGYADVTSSIGEFVFKEMKRENGALFVARLPSFRRCQRSGVGRLSLSLILLRLIRILLLLKQISRGSAAANAAPGVAMPKLQMVSHSFGGVGCPTHAFEA